MENRYCDVLIIGAGPAGSMVAYEIKKADADLEVLVIEKSTIPRYKACGGGIQAKTLDILPFKIDQVVEDVIYGVNFSSNCKKQFTRLSDLPIMYNVMRSKFDAFLLSKACELGVTILDGQNARQFSGNGEEVKVKTDDSQFSCRILIGADGARSTVARSFGLMRNAPSSFAIETEIYTDPEFLEVHRKLITIDWGTLRNGYAWIFPKSDHLSIGVGTCISLAKELKDYYYKFLSYQDLGKYETNIFKGFPLTHRKMGMSIQIHNVLLVGDAAGLIDCFTGEGVYYAIRSAQLAASVVIQKLNTPTIDLMEYQDAVDSELTCNLMDARLLSKSFNLAPQKILKTISQNDRVWLALCKVMRGERTYQSYIEKSPWLKIVWKAIDKLPGSNRCWESS